MATMASGLGRLFDIGLGIMTVNLNAGANTGKNMGFTDWMYPR